jgi:large subunit ribosomal protein L10
MKDSENVPVVDTAENHSPQKHKGVSVPAYKKKIVSDLSERISHAKTVMIVSIKSVPSKQFQEIKKSIREHAFVYVAKKNLMKRALEKVGRESLMPLEKYILENCAFVISDIESFELAAILSKKKTSAFAKAGQIAPIDIEIPEGPTSLVPGPAISELGALGIQIAVEDGKIAIKKPKVVTHEGAEISGGVASLLQKLNIQPMNIGLDPVAVYDIEHEKLYTDIKIDSEGAVVELQSASGKALGFAQKIIYICKETLGYFLAKANAEELKFSGLIGSKELKTEEKEENVEEKKEEVTEEKKEEIGEEKKEENPNTQVNNPEELA